MTDHPPLAVWLADLEADGARIPSIAARLGLDTEGGAADPHRRLAHLALRSLLAGYVGETAARAPFSSGPEGKPYVASAHTAGKPLEFSLAHADGMALIAISTAGIVGIDIEVPRPVRIVDRRRAELEAVARSLAPGVPLPSEPPDTRFLQAWVRLEAVAKATGEGIGSLLGRIREGSGVLSPHPTREATLAVLDLHLPSTRPLHAAIALAATPDANGPPSVARFPDRAGWLIE
ncbi:MAG: hypothetical protein JSS20_03320 [Proteobacteria bacterium]|nr:hypothetical protein [Pseudomonadota bacterium]